MIVLRERHPFEGRTLPVMGTLKRRGVLSVLVVLPDGSRSLIPASWTDWKTTGRPKSLAQTRERCIATLADLLHARAIVDALLGRCPIRQPAHEESRNAVDAELSPGLPSTKTAKHQSRPRNACRSRQGFARMIAQAAEGSKQKGTTNE